MPITIQQCNEEANRLLLLLQQSSPKNKLLVTRSTRQKFSLILQELDKVNIVTKIHCIQTEKPSLAFAYKKYKYRYNVYVNANIEKTYMSRTYAKLHIFRLYIKHCPCPQKLKLLMPSS